MNTTNLIHWLGLGPIIQILHGFHIFSNLLDGLVSLAKCVLVSGLAGSPVFPIC